MIRFILADLKRFWPGVVAVVLLVAFASALGMAVRIEERALRLGSARAADRFDLVVGAPGSETQLILSSIFLQPSPLTLIPGSVLQTLSQDPRVEFAAPVGFGDSYRGYQIVGTSAEFIAKSGFGIAEGSNLAGTFDAVVGSLVSVPLGTVIHPVHGVAGEATDDHPEISYRIVGRMKETATPWDRAILVPIEGVWRTHGLGEAEGAHAHDAHDAHEAHGGEGEAHAAHDSGEERIGPPWTGDLPGVPAILVKPKTIANAYQLRGEYRTEATLAVFPGEVLTRLYSTLGDARLALGATAAAAQALAGAAVMLVTMMHLAQRRRQIGALRAFGAPRLAIFAVVWAELVLVIGVGIAAGLGLGYAAAHAISATITRQSGMTLPVTIDGNDILFAGLLLAIAGVISLVPAWIAYRQPIARALRS
ncbi:FtsX-like permease family protein [Shinella zoogloeoides]